MRTLCGATEVHEPRVHRRAEEQFKRQRELEDRRRLDREKEREESARRETHERVLRARHGERARFFEQALGEEARGFATGVQTANCVERYPGLARHYQGQRADRWEFMSIETQVIDYGTALYKGRPLETALERIPTKWKPVRLENARQNKRLETPA